MEDKNLYIYLNQSGNKIKTSGLTLTQNSTNSMLNLVTVGKYDNIKVSFKFSDGSSSAAYHMVYKGKYELDSSDIEPTLVENADNLYLYQLNVPYAVTSAYVPGTNTRISFSVACYNRDKNMYLKQIISANSAITVNASTQADSLDDSYSPDDVENLWSTVGSLYNEVQDIIDHQEETSADVLEERITDIETGVTKTFAQWDDENNEIKSTYETKYDASAKLAEALAYTDSAVAGKQNTLTFDSVPTESSQNPVESGGVYTALQSKQDNLTFDNSPTSDSNNPVKSGGVYTALSGKQDNLTFDNEPVNGSNNPVKSGGVYSALSGKQDNLTFDLVPTESSDNPVTSDGIYSAIQDVREVASGKTATFVVSDVSNPAFDSQNATITISALPTFISGSTTITSLSDLNLGDVFYVTETDVPDRWVSTTGSASVVLSKMETAKVPVNDVKINGTSIVSNEFANFNTISVYDASTNKIATKSDIPTLVSDLSNDTGYLTTAVTSINGDLVGDISGIALVSDIPTLVSDLSNDAGYITSSDITVSDIKVNGTSILSSKEANFVTNTAYDSTTNKIATMSDIPDVSNYITASDLPTVVSDLSNDAGYITSSDLPTLVSDLSNDAGYLSSVSYSNIVSTGETSGKVLAADGSGGASWITIDTGTPSNMLTTDTDQTISGIKTFNDGKLKINGTTYAHAKIINSNSSSRGFSLCQSVSDDVFRFTTEPASGNPFEITPSPSLGGTYNLGSSSTLWSNLYLSGNLTDGTNSIAIANIADKSSVPSVVSDLSNDAGYITVSDISDLQPKTDLALTTDASTVVGAINETYSLAKQAGTAKSYASYSALITDLNAAEADEYNVGQSFYIQTLEVPDLWILAVDQSSSTYTYTTDAAFVTATGASGGQKVGYYKLAQLETQKVDLTNYATTSQLSDKMNKSNPTGTGSLSINRKASTTIGDYSIAIGYNNAASGNYSTAIGINNTASGVRSVALGDNTYAIGTDATAMGDGTRAEGNYSFATGSHTKAYGSYSHTEGMNTQTGYQYNHAEGYNTFAYGSAGHAEGIGTNYTILLTGSGSVTTYTYSFQGTSTTPEVGMVVRWDGSSILQNTRYITAVNTNTSQITLNSSFNASLSNATCTLFARGAAFGDYSHTEGGYNNAIGNYSHAEGRYTKAMGLKSHSEGEYTEASGEMSHAEGNHTVASGETSHAEGEYTNANGTNSHAEGYYTTAYNSGAHSEGKGGVAYGGYSHVEGFTLVENSRPYLKLTGNANAKTYTIVTTGSGSSEKPDADGKNLFDIASTGGLCGTSNGLKGLILDYNGTKAKITSNSRSGTGFLTGYTYTLSVDNTLSSSAGLTEAIVYLDGIVASASASHAEGFSTVAASNYQHVSGRLNVIDASDTYAEIVGNGNTSNGERSNARTLDWSGNEVLSGSITASSIKKKNGTSSQFLKADGSVDSTTYAAASAIPTVVSDLSNDAGYITGITSGDVTTALGFTPLANTACTYTTTAPSAAISDGGVHIVYLTSEPATKYSGYIYMIAES